LKQYAVSRRQEAPRIAQAYTDELHTYAAMLATTSRTDPDFAARILNTLVTEIAHTRNREGTVTDPHFDINPAGGTRMTARTLVPVVILTAGTIAALATIVDFLAGAAR
jgi:hypothetical protein